jgi:formate/nitrite transporter FocA (FNT family)
MTVAFASVCSSELNNEFLQRLSMALVYPLGFIKVIMGATQLFTEHTALVVYPFLDKKCSFLEVNKVWAVF